MSDDLEDRVTRWAREREDVHALALVGSRARTDDPADEWSDHDFVVVVDDPLPYFADADWLAALGRVLVTFVDVAAAAGLPERRVLFADGADVDFTFVPSAAVPLLRTSHEVAAVVGRGLRVLVDEDGLLAELPTEAPAAALDLTGVVHEFWYRALWTARKLARGEVHLATQACNCALRAVLRRALEVEARAAGRDAWHEGRFLERWADPGFAARLPLTVASEDAAGVATALGAACDLFSDVCAALGERYGLAAGVDEAALRAQIQAALGSVDA